MLFNTLQPMCLIEQLYSVNFAATLNLSEHCQSCPTFNCLHFAFLLSMKTVANQTMEPPVVRTYIRERDIVLLCLHLGDPITDISTCLLSLSLSLFVCVHERANGQFYLGQSVVQCHKIAEPSVLRQVRNVYV